MPLIQCQDCHREISSSAPACIHCGRHAAVGRTDRFAEAHKHRNTQMPSGMSHAHATGGKGRSDVHGGDSTFDGAKPGTDKWATIGGIAAFAFMFLVPRLFTGGLGYGIAYGTFFGGIVGLWPYHVARRQGRIRLATAAIVTCGFGGAISGLLLALPVAVLFVIGISLTRPKAYLIGDQPGAPERPRVALTCPRERYHVLR